MSERVLIDGYNRRVDYLRMSVTDRCDFRCVYCMAEDMTFLPRHELLSHEELILLSQTLCDLGVTKLRITGGEPLVRRGIVELIAKLNEIPQQPELCLTTNGVRLAPVAQALKEAGLDRINISLDSLDPLRFRELTRVGDLSQVLAGIKAAQAAGFTRIKLNCVALKHSNADEVPALVKFALAEGLDISFIEEMPLGHIGHHQRAQEFVSSAELRAAIAQEHDLIPCEYTSGGPARYWRVPGYESRLGFISPHSENFCSSCNRVRVTAIGRLILCLGQENAADLRQALRNSSDPRSALIHTLQTAITHKPEKHDFQLDDSPQILRFMNLTGG